MALGLFFAPGASLPRIIAMPPYGDAHFIGITMYTETTFKAELELIWSTVTSFKPHWYKMGSKEVEINDAWAMYLNARNSNLSELLLGDLKLRSQIEVLKNFGTTSGTETTMERGTLFNGKKKVNTGQVITSVKKRRGKGYRGSDGIAHIRCGSVLNDGWWWPFKNDAWVMGGIHGLKRFHLTMASAPDDLVWDQPNGRPRVLGRELLGLAAFGYSLIGVPSWAKKDPVAPVTTPPTVGPKPPVKTTPVPAQNIRDMIGNVFAPQVKATAQAGTFTEYYAALARVTSINDIKNGILKNEVAFDSYDFSKI